MNLIKTTNILMGKGVKMSKELTKNDGWYVWEVTDEALAKIRAKRIGFELVK